MKSRWKKRKKTLWIYFDTRGESILLTLLLEASIGICTCTLFFFLLFISSRNYRLICILGKNLSPDWQVTCFADKKSKNLTLNLKVGVSGKVATINWKPVSPFYIRVVLIWKLGTFFDGIFFYSSFGITRVALCTETIPWAASPSPLGSMQWPIGPTGGDSSPATVQRANPSDTTGWYKHIVIPVDGLLVTCGFKNDSYFK